MFEPTLIKRWDSHGAIALVAAALLAFDPHAVAAPHDQETFLDLLEGDWQGQAVITPIGPRPYNITFHRAAGGTLEGSAQPGGATHTWTFVPDGATLRLRFHSTFRGNPEPIQLISRGAQDGAWMFAAVKPDFLSVSIQPRQETALIQVLHHGRLHVEIRLERR